MKLSNTTKSRITLALLFFAFDFGIFVIAKLAPSLHLDPFTWIMLVFAASFGGASIAYLYIGDWFRWIVTKEVPHSSNSSMTEIEPKYDGWLKSVGVLICCPICAGAWVGASLLGLMALNHDLGYYTIVALAIGGAARIVTRFSEMVEWQSRYAQERVAELNRKNAIEEALKDYAPYFQSQDSRTYRVTKDEEAPH